VTDIAFICGYESEEASDDEVVEPVKELEPVPEPVPEPTRSWEQPIPSTMIQEWISNRMDRLLSSSKLRESLCNFAQRAPTCSVDASLRNLVTVTGATLDGEFVTFSFRGTDAA
jgi:hypothetical protein